MYNFAPRRTPDQVDRAASASIQAMRDSGFSNEQLEGEQLPLLASSVLTRSGLPLETRRDLIAAERLAGIAIGNNLAKHRAR